MIHASHGRRQRSAEFRFYEELNDFLPENHRKTDFSYPFEDTPSVLDTIQAIGVPHTEVDLILVDGVSVGFDHRLHGGERVAVYPVFERLDIGPLLRLRPEPLRRPRFMADTHLGKLARYLRMLGFDTAWRMEQDDRELIDQALQQQRIILTRDLGLLKHRRVTHGYWLRHQQPDEQLEEVLLELDLLERLRPFSRCMECNGNIETVKRSEIADVLDPDILARFDSFWRCGACAKIYWRGSHYRRMLQFTRLATGKALVGKLFDVAAYPHPAEHIQRVETHISWVILTGEFAYKIKKPVELGFLDFSTLELRSQFCEEELRVNRRTAPELYLDVVPIGMTPNGPRIGAKPPIEYAVKMRQFPHDARLDRQLQAGDFDAGKARELAATIARFHCSLSPRRDIDAELEAERTIRPARNNFRHLDPGSFSDTSQQHLAVIEDWTLRQSESLRPVIGKRALAGAVRECHGDLHLENLLYLDGRFVLFDAIEFNPELRWIDTANDIAFLVMDLMARGRADLAFGVLNAWLENNGDYQSLAVMRYYLAYRSMVRAVVTSIRRRQQPAGSDNSFRPESDRYIDLAAELVDTPPPRLLMMHGFSGSGKTWCSERLVGELPALRIRSDLERKRLRGLSVEQRVTGSIDAGLYGPELTDQTYRVLAECCETGLRAGFSMIADATFLHRRHRRLFLDLARRLGVQPGIVDCRADAATLQQRIRKRHEGGKDASDADLDVLEHQLQHHDPLDEDEKALLYCSGGNGP
jgi:aminoglycoside phosphotransferase family enzyme/predicted kinase